MSAMPAQMCRILIVDDVVDNLFLLQTLLEAEGYSVETADNGVTALHKIQTAPPHLVLLDLMMPGMTGFEVTQRIRQDQQLAALPIVLLTAYDDIATSCLQIGADDLVRKPVDFDELLAKVAAYIPDQATSAHS